MSSVTANTTSVCRAMKHSLCRDGDPAAIRKWSLWGKGCVQGHEALPAQPCLRDFLCWAHHSQQGLCDTQNLFARLETLPCQQEPLRDPTANWLSSVPRCLPVALQASASHTHRAKTSLHPWGGTEPQGCQSWHRNAPVVPVHCRGG